MGFLARPFCILFSVIFAISAAQADERLLSDAAWRKDIALATEKISQGHPMPFRKISAQEFESRVSALIDDVPALSDKEIVVRLAAIVASVKDGHTRLSIPREHPEIGLEFGHTGTQAPDIENLKFKQLPVAFDVFEDGIFITAATPALQHLIGRKLTAIDDMTAQAAFERVQQITFAENTQLEKLMGADRLSIPEALAALGVVKNAENITLYLEAPDGEASQHVIKPLPGGDLEWVMALDGEAMPLHAQAGDKKHWWKYLRRERIVYAKLNEIGDGEMRLAEFVAMIIGEAESRNAKLVIDLRNNFGGSNDLNITLVLALIQSRELNQYGRTFVLTGRRTFSAAQLLINDLEHYTRILFVGEATGARPDHFGDSKKTRLPNSGLTLRVSSLHWSSYLADDNRQATSPDLPAPWTSLAYFSGDDPALETALGYKHGGLISLLRPAFYPLNLQKIVRYMALSIRSPDSFQADKAPVILQLGREFSSRGERQNASIAYQVGLYFYPDHPELVSAFEALDAADE